MCAELWMPTSLRKSFVTRSVVTSHIHTVTHIRKSNRNVHYDHSLLCFIVTHFSPRHGCIRRKTLLASNLVFSKCLQPGCECTRRRSKKWVFIIISWLIYSPFYEAGEKITKVTCAAHTTLILRATRRTRWTAVKYYRLLRQHPHLHLLDDDVTCSQRQDYVRVFDTTFLTHSFTHSLIHPFIHSFPHLLNRVKKTPTTQEEAEGKQQCRHEFYIWALVKRSSGRN